MRTKETSRDYSPLRTDCIIDYIMKDAETLVELLKGENLTKYKRGKLQKTAATLNNLIKMIEE